MGRIYEALQRAGVHAALPSPATAQSTDPAPEWTQETPAREFTQVPRARQDQPAVQPILPAVHPELVRSASLDAFALDWTKRLIVAPDIDPFMKEQFRRLAAALVHAERADNLKMIMITSAVPAEGKTLTALNLALVLSESYRRRVLLIDADLRRPAISNATNMSLSDGLNEAVNASDDRKAPLVQLTSHLTLLPAGRSVLEPLSTLTSQRMGLLLAEARERFDWVILDTPPVTAVADAGLLCPLVDAALLVINAGRTPHAAVQRAVDTLGRDRILGVVLNSVDPRQATEYGDYGQYYSDRPSEVR